MKHRIFVLSAIFALYGCKTTPESIPSLFQGQAGWKAVPGTISEMKPHGGSKTIIVTRNVIFPRTGMLVEDAKFGLLPRLTLNAGTPVFAAVYGNQDVDMAWCTPGNKNGFNQIVIPQSKRSYCMFYNPTNGQASVAPGRNGNFWADKFITPAENTSRQYGAIPKIEEGPVDFGLEFTIGLRITKVRKNTVQVSGVFSTSEDNFETPYGGISLEFDKKGKAVWNVWGGTLELMKIDGKNVSVRILRPFTESTYTGTWANRLRTQDRY